jgi:membrane peptidoglycan carboxypeptidase
LRAFFARHSARGKKRLILEILGWGALVGMALLAILFFIVTRGLPSPEQIANPPVTESTKIYDRTGTVLLYEISGGQKRTYVGFDEVPQYLKDTTLAIEDSDFYNQGAFSVKGILRSLWYDVTNPGGALRGGSTITQQLARNAFLSLEQTLTRKLKELIVAVEIDRQYTKDKVLELYLNTIPYGPTIYGVEGASQAYFSKPVKDLTLAQSAVLAAIPKAPSFYSPWGNNVKLLIQRQRLVLQRTYDTGRITKQQLDSALAEPVVFSPPSGRGLKAAHFVTAVEDYLSERYGDDILRTGGLQVVTTLDWDLQQLGEKVVADGAERNEKLYGGTNAALIAEDPRTGQILAMVGSRDYFAPNAEGQFNVVTQGLRQPGSTLKPFIYLNAFIKGYTPETVLFDVPTEFSGNSACPLVPTAEDFKKNDTRCFHPQDYEGVGAGPVSMRNALAQSINIPAVQALYLTGLRSSIGLMQSVGLTTLDDPDKYGLALVLGGGAVHLMDLARAYSVLSQDGIMREQSLILEVRDKNKNILEQYRSEEKQVVDANYARTVTDILSDANARSGLFHSSLGLTVFPGYDVALKTGTSNDYRDAWTMGYTPSLVVGVWAGNNDNSPMHRQGSSILAAVPMWSAFMKGALPTQPPQSFINPEPLPANKPIFTGQYVENGQAHSILYYVDRDDPTGPPPSNPASDPQFNRWEASVQTWAASHAIDIMNAGNTASSTPSSTQENPPLIEEPEPEPQVPTQTPNP